jgi:hypothetical protein
VLEGGAERGKSEGVGVDLIRPQPLKAVDTIQTFWGGVAGELAGEEKVDNRIGRASVLILVNLRAEERQRAGLDTDLLADFAVQTLLGGLAVIDKTAWEPEFAFGGLLRAMQEQELAGSVAEESRACDGRVEEEDELATSAAEDGLRGRDRGG